MLLEDAFRTQADERMKAGVKFTQGAALSGKTRDQIGSAIGMSGVSYERLRAVIHAAGAGPDHYGDLLTLLGKYGRIVGPFQTLQRRRAAA